MKISISELKLPNSGALVVGILTGGVLPSTAKQLDKASNGAITKAMKASRFTGAKGQWLDVLAPAGIDADRVLLGGLGDGNAHDHVNLPTLVGGGGAALKGDRHVRCPDETPMANLLLTLLDKAGVPTPERIGDSTEHLVLG